MAAIAPGWLVMLLPGAPQDHADTPAPLRSMATIQRGDKVLHTTMSVAMSELGVALLASPVPQQPPAPAAEAANPQLVSMLTEEG